MLAYDIVIVIANNDDFIFIFTLQDKIKEKVMTELNCPQLDLPPLDTSEKKFNAQSRLFVGNLPRDIPYEELKEMFTKYGELGQVYFNKDGAYAFINFVSKVFSI